MKVGLPDINVLIALAWPSHIHHQHARRWFDSDSRDGWATCPFTQTGFIRISSNPKILPYAVTPHEALLLLKQLTTWGKHMFWPADLDFTADAELPVQALIGHKQVTDAYLLGLATRRRGKLVTLDQNIVNLLPQSSPQRNIISVIQAV